MPLRVPVIASLVELATGSRSLVLNAGCDGRLIVAVARITRARVVTPPLAAGLGLVC
jgi:hypothetical protein